MLAGLGERVVSFPLRLPLCGLASGAKETTRVGKVRVGMIGCGVVGQGVMRLLREDASSIEARLGGSMDVRRIVARARQKPRGPYVPAALVGYEVEPLLADPEIDVVIELMGGVDEAG